MSRFARWVDHEPPQHSMDFDGEFDGAVSGMKTAVTTDRERELWCGVAEARTGDDRHSVKLALALDDGPQGVLVHVGGPLELPEHHTPHALETRLVDEGLQLPVEVDGTNLLVVFEEEDGSLQFRHVQGAEEQAKGAQVPSERRSLRLAFVDDLVAGVRNEVAVLLVLVPEIITPVVSR